MTRNCYGGLLTSSAVYSARSFPRAGPEWLATQVAISAASRTPSADRWARIESYNSEFMEVRYRRISVIR